MDNIVSIAGERPSSRRIPKREHVLNDRERNDDRLDPSDPGIYPLRGPSGT